MPPLPQVSVALGVHTPGSLQALNADQRPLSQVRVCVPQKPQLCELVSPAVHSTVAHAPQVQLAVHDWVRPAPQAWVSPGAQAPSPVQLAGALHVPSLPQVETPVPHWPQAVVIVLPAVQVHALQVQPSTQVCEPLAQARVAPGVQAAL